jgi:hypothetical protein
MTLQDKLDRIAEAASKQIPAAAWDVMKRNTRLVADSMTERSIPGTGDILPPFELPDSQGRMVSSHSLAAEGPFVLTFFRGKW